MTEDEKSPRDRLLDLFVFGPAGLAMTAAEEFPKLVEKGRHRIEGQVHTARLVGQFAVQMGRQQVEQAVGGFVKSRQGPVAPEPAVSVPAPPPAPAPPAPNSVVQLPAEPAEPGADVAHQGPPVSTNGTMTSGVLAIPGYDSLSASQVVQRLGGLSGSELHAIQEHEQAHRRRRTILSRVEQLLAGER
ncbi:MAG: hypothetical protein ACYDD4_09700 [Acidimicrobiales bacterium]